nr:hypothetical protein [Actinomycetota bacterium]
MSDPEQPRRPRKAGRNPNSAPEPEGGPERRKKDFLDERLTPLRPRGPEDDEEAIEEEAPPSPRARKALRSEPSRPARPSPGFRRALVSEYRERQREQLDQPRKRGGAGGGRKRRPPETRAEIDSQPGAEPPQPPVPPPANNWIPIGPSAVRQGQGGTRPPVSGRVLGFAVGTGGNPVYAATSNGGVWRSDDAGGSWRSLMEAWDLDPTNTASDSLSCGAIAIDPTDSDRIFLGTGDGDEGAYFGVGPVVSTDGGVNWSTEPVTAASAPLAGSAFYALAVDPGNPARVVAGTRRGVYRREPDGAGGFVWAQKALGGLTTWVPSVVVARAGGTTTFYAANWFGPVFSSTDGNTWTQVGTGFPATVGRVALGIRPEDPGVVYAAVTTNTDYSILGVWRLDTSDNTWRQVTGHPADLVGTAAIGFQGSYDLAIAVDPNNANLIYLGGSTKASSGEWSGCSYRCPVTGAGAGA